MPGSPAPGRRGGDTPRPRPGRSVRRRERLRRRPHRRRRTLDRAPSRRRRRSCVDGRCRLTATASDDDGPAKSSWTLPPVTLLHRADAQSINRAEVEARGRVLQESLQQHGVETPLVGMTVGPTVTRFELELGPGVKVARVTSLQQGHRLRDGRGRRAHPRSRSPAARRSASRSPTTTASSSPSATCWRRPRPARPPPAGGRDRQGHRRPGGVPRPRHDAPPADRRRHRRRQVERHQLHHHVAADAHDARPGAPDPRRPQAGRDGPVQPAAPPAHPARHQPEEGGQRARRGR